MQPTNEDNKILIESWIPEKETESKIQLLPFRIEYNGPANIDTFFLPEISSEDEMVVLKCSFRGHRLIGSEIQLPSDYKGVMFKENINQKNIPDKDGISKIRSWKVDSFFKKFVYWTKKIGVSHQDMPRRWMQWIEMSKSIHKPVTEQDLTQPLKFILNPQEIIVEKNDEDPVDGDNNKKRKRQESSPEENLPQKKVC